MIKVENIEMLPADFEAGCTNGNYQDALIHLDNGSSVYVTTCRCGNGCSGTACINGIVGRKFENLHRLNAFLYGDDDDHNARLLQ